MAQPIRMSGMVSGLDTESLVTALTSGYKTKVDKYKKAQTKVSWKQDAWKDVNKKVYSLYTSLDALRFSSNWRLQKATSSDATKATVTSNGKAFVGSQKLKIDKTASSASITGGKLTRASSGSTTLLALGYTSGKSANIYVEKGDGSSTAIEVNGNTTINEFVSKLQDQGLSANYDSTNQRLYINSKTSGAAGDFNLKIYDADTVNDSDAKTRSTQALSALGLLYTSDTVQTTKYDDLLTDGTTDVTDEQRQNAINNGVSLDTLEDNIASRIISYNDATASKSKNEAARTNLNAGKNYADAYKLIDDVKVKYGIDSSDLYLMGFSTDSLAVPGDGGKYTELKKGETTGDVTKYSSSDGKTTIYEKNGAYYTDEDATTKYNGSSVTKASTLQAAEVLDKIIAVDNKAADGEPQKTYSEYAGDSEEATNAMSVAMQAYSADNYMTAYLRAGDDGLSADDTANGLYTRQTIANLVKSNYTGASKADDGTFTEGKISDDFTETINTALNKVNTAISSADDTIANNSSIAALAKSVPDGSTKESLKTNDAVVNFAKEAQAAFAAEKAQADSAPTSGDKYAKKIEGADAQIELGGMTYTSSSNNFSINGLSIQALSTTDDDGITITTQTDTDGLYDKIKDFFSTYNDVINDLTDRYNAESSGDYEPLTDDEKEQMSDSEVEKWEKKVKTGLLRRDSTLDSIMSTMTNTMLKSYTVNNKKYSLASFGIMTKGILNASSNRQYEYHIDGDEDDESVSSKQDKLRAAINADPDSVIDFMQQLTNDLYQNLDKKMKSTSMKSAYTIYNDKEMASEYSSYNDLISQWQTRLSTMEESYYKKFSQMESTLAKLQSSTSSLSNSLG